MHKIFVMRRFVHAAVQIITSLAERVRSISGDGAPFRSPQDIILKSPPLCLHPDILIWLLPTASKTSLCIYWLGLRNQPCTKSCKTPHGFFEQFLPNCWFESWILLQGMSLAQYIAGSRISSNMMFLQPWNAKQALLEETLWKNGFGTNWGWIAITGVKTRVWTEKFEKTIGVVQFFLQSLFCF